MLEHTAPAHDVQVGGGSRNVAAYNRPLAGKGERLRVFRQTFGSAVGQAQVQSCPINECDRSVDAFEDREGGILIDVGDAHAPGEGGCVRAPGPDNDLLGYAMAILPWRHLVLIPPDDLHGA
jgi:hypothetical protein